VFDFSHGLIVAAQNKIAHSGAQLATGILRKLSSMQRRLFLSVSFGFYSLFCIPIFEPGNSEAKALPLRIVFFSQRLTLFYLPLGNSVGIWFCERTDFIMNC